MVWFTKWLTEVLSLSAKGRAARPAGMQTRTCELSNRGFTTSYYVELPRAAARPARAAAADVAQVHRYEPPSGGVAEAAHDGAVRKGVCNRTVVCGLRDSPELPSCGTTVKTPARVQHGGTQDSHCMMILHNNTYSFVCCQYKFNEMCTRILLTARAAPGARAAGARIGMRAER